MLGNRNVIKNLTIAVHKYVLWWSGFLWIRHYLNVVLVRRNIFTDKCWVNDVYIFFRSLFINWHMNGLADVQLRRIRRMTSKVCPQKSRLGQRWLFSESVIRFSNLQISQKNHADHRFLSLLRPKNEKHNRSQFLTDRLGGKEAWCQTHFS